MSDSISKQEVLNILNFVALTYGHYNGYKALTEAKRRVKELSSAEPEEFEWCHDCKEYDQEQHCCHRWTKVIRNTVEELKAERKGNWIGIDDEPCETFECDRCGFVLDDWTQGVFYNFCPNCGADMRGEEDESD